MKKAILIFSFLLLEIFFCNPLFALGPPGPPGGGGGPPPCWPPPCVPIDGGIGLLMAAGMAFGARKMYVMYKKTED